MQGCAPKLKEYLKGEVASSDAQVHKRSRSFWEEHKVAKAMKVAFSICKFDLKFIAMPISRKVGDWVAVQEDYTPGMCSEGGLGSIIHIHHGADPEESDLMVEEECSLVDVKYMLTGWVERNTTHKASFRSFLCL